MAEAYCVAKGWAGDIDQGLRVARLVRFRL